MTSELSRSQQRNLSDCIQKISAIIAEASEKPREPTEEDVALRAARYHPVRACWFSIHLDYKCILYVSLTYVTYVVQVREDEQGATETEEDPFSYQEEQTSGL